MTYKDPARQKEYGKQWYLKNKEKAAKSSKRYRLKNREKISEYQKQYNLKNNEKKREWSKRWALKNREKKRENDKQYRLKMRLFVLKKIDPNLKCVRCGCTDIRFLEVNHKNGGGGKESRCRNQTTKSILSHNRRIDDLDLLCRPCNHIHFLELKYKEEIPLVTHFINNDWEKEL